jgi:K+-transporting ATPase ATPase A chain
MTVNGWIQIAIFVALVLALVRPLGAFMTRVFNGERTFLTPVLRSVEQVLYAAGGVDEKSEQHWVTYTVAMLLFNLVGLLALYALQRLQAVLPLNPQGQSAVAPDLAFNTAVSFTTNTNWQNYAGESTMSYLVQMAGLTVHNYASAATRAASPGANGRGPLHGPRERRPFLPSWIGGSEPHGDLGFRCTRRAPFARGAAAVCRAGRARPAEGVPRRGARRRQDL